jgi:predicted site-specific integrase-resolvase
VSSAAQKPDLKNQRRVLEEFCAARGLDCVEWIEEVGGGLNFERKRFVAVMEAIERREVKALVIAHKDRLVRLRLRVVLNASAESTDAICSFSTANRFHANRRWCRIS